MNGSFGKGSSLQSYAVSLCPQWVVYLAFSCLLSLIRDWRHIREGSTTHWGHTSGTHLMIGSLSGRVTRIPIRRPLQSQEQCVISHLLSPLLVSLVSLMALTGDNKWRTVPEIEKVKDQRDPFPYTGCSSRSISIIIGYVFSSEWRLIRRKERPMIIEIEQSNRCGPLKER
jgi:hypothetical protein